MKTLKFWLFSLVTASILSCGLVDAPLPLDWPIKPDPTDTIVVDTIPVDTIIVDTIVVPVDTPCTNPTVKLKPEFVTLYVEFDILEDSIRWQGGGVESYNLADVIAAVTPHPFHIFNEGKSWAVVIDSTNDHQYFQLKVFARSNGAKVYMGSAKQSFIFAGALTFEEYRQIAIQYPSVDRFNFRNTNWTSAQYEEVAAIILGECKLGRTWADFRFNAVPILPATKAAFIAAHWATVLG